MPTAARRATLPPFSTPRPFVKSEPTDDPAPGTAGEPFGAQASIPVMNDLSTNHGSSAAKSRPFSSSALPMSAGFKSAAQHTFQQQLKAEGTRHSTGSLLPLASQSGPSPGSFSWGLPFGVAQPIRGPFAGTVFDPIPRANSAHEATQPTDQAVARQAAVTEPKAESKSDWAVVDSVTSVGPTDGVTDVQLAAVNAAAEDKQAAEQFADGAVQSPAAEGLHQPVSNAVPVCKAVCYPHMHSVGDKLMMHKGQQAPPCCSHHFVICMAHITLFPLLLEMCSRHGSTDRCRCASA